jgi:hypothetical protein
LAKLWKWFDFSFAINRTDGLTDEPILAGCLDHGRSLVPHTPGQVKRVDWLVSLDKTCRGLHQDEDSRPPDTSTAVDQCRCYRRALLPRLSDHLDKLDELSVAVRCAVVRPGEVLHLTDHAGLLIVIGVGQGEVSEGETLVGLVLGARDGDAAEHDRLVLVGPVLVTLDTTSLDNLGTNILA